MGRASGARVLAWVCVSGMAASLLGAHEVATVEQLVAALEAVNGGDADTVVRIAPGYYDVSGCAMDEKGCLSIQRANVVIEGTDPTSWRETTDRNAKVVLDAKYARSVFNLLPALTGVRFHHLTIQNGTNTNAKLEDGAGAGIQHGWYNGTYAAVSNCVFRNNRALGQGGGGHELNLYDCYFTNNVAKEGGAVLATQVTWDSLFECNSAVDNGGALRNGSEIQRCVFVGNTAGTGGCNYGGDYWAVDCLCVSNTASQGGAFGAEWGKQGLRVRNSRFVGNRSTGTGATAGMGGALLYPSFVTNCVFVGNQSRTRGGAVAASTNLAQIVDCAFTNNAAVDGGAVSGNDGAWQQPTVSACDFVGNCATNDGGGVVKCAVVSNCTFTGCWTLRRGGAAFNAALVDCVVSNCHSFAIASAAGVGSDAGHRLAHVAFIDCGCATNEAGRVAATGCHFEDCSFLRCNPASVILSAVRCRIVGNGLYRPGDLFAGGAWTNCLITGIAAQYLFRESRLVNCTVVSNNWGTDGQLFAVGASAVNCIFKGNYHNGGKAWDIAGYGHYYLTNCVYKAHPGWGDTYTIHDTDCVRETAKLFLDPAHPDFDARNPYALAPASPARNAGAALDWDDGACDLAGNPRVFLRDGVGRVDVGCYEYSVLPRGTLLIFR